MPFLAHLARCCTAPVWSDQNTVKLQAIAKELFSIKIPLTHNPAATLGLASWGFGAGRCSH
jgi:hypothetical protein